jgi:hypothetical protein
MSEFKFPTEFVELPSKGLLYPSENPLSSGKLEIKYMSAREEDILTNQSYIQDGTVFDRLFKSLIVTPIDYDDLLIGDKNALMVAARILGMGAKYDFKYRGKDESVDLTTLKNKEVDYSLFKNGENHFTFTLPHSGNVLTFKLLTHKDERQIDDEIKGLQSISKADVGILTTRLKYMITSVNGKTDKEQIRNFVNNEFLSLDTREFRKFINKISPDINLTFFPSGSKESTSLPLGLSFLWPDEG